MKKVKNDLEMDLKILNIRIPEIFFTNTWNSMIGINDSSQYLENVLVLRLTYNDYKSPFYIEYWGKTSKKHVPITCN